MKWNKKYKYAGITRTEEHGSRLYDVLGIRLPSVTTVLSRTKDQSYLDKWKAKVGYEEAERIKNLSSTRGTAMHKYLESYLRDEQRVDLTPLGQEARIMAQKIIEKGMPSISEYYGSEVGLYYPGLYAGSTDLVCLLDGVETIVDFKQANRPKREEWIGDYKLQIAAYAMAHDYIHGSNIEQGTIMACTPDLYYQEFKFNGEEMRKCRHQFLKRLGQFYDQNVS